MSQTLAGLGIVVTRPKKQNAEFCRKLAQAGAQVLEFPTIEIQPLNFPADFSVQNYRWIILTSANGVEIFLDQLRHRPGFAIDQLRQVRFGVIGEKTRKKLESRGFKAECCPVIFRAEKLFEALMICDAEALKKGARVLLARARKAREVLPELLAACGAQVEVLPLYETIVPAESGDEVIASMIRGEVHWVTFTSSSSVDGFFEKVSGKISQPRLKKLDYACIGPITESTLRGYGLKPRIVSQTFTTDALFQDLQKYYERGVI